MNDVEVKCETCEVFIKARHLKDHNSSRFHTNNTNSRSHLIDNVKVINTALGQRIRTYHITAKNDYNMADDNFTDELFWNSVNEALLKLLEECVDEYIIFKVNLILFIDFTQHTKSAINTVKFTTCYYLIHALDDFNKFIFSMKDKLGNKISKFKIENNDWTLSKITHIEMNINKFNALRKSSFIDLPNDIKNKKAVINVKNTDNQCIKWALLSALYPVPIHVDRVASYMKHENKLKLKNIKFPVKFKDISKIEEQNNISINVFGLKYDRICKINKVIGPIYFTKNFKGTHINLLYLTNNGCGHYCYIKNLSRLLKSQLTRKNITIYICSRCLLYFRNKNMLSRHRENNCIGITRQL